MSADGLWLDGNAIAGLLRELFGAELTAAERGCQTCGAVTCLGAHRVYRSAGTVVRCPVCGDLALRITTLPDRHVVHLAGSWSLEMPRE
ncbi:MAG TPA: DUF6510 family protein [Solirubrobacteraceae bacterium]|jgi:hypothetical protein|nr:DUF6510 family protein [Solirubrobacteraceae bacterium]